MVLIRLISWISADIFANLRRTTVEAPKLNYEMALVVRSTG
jgi:hypothetical protein